MEIAVEGKNKEIRSDFGFDESISFRIRFNVRQEYLNGNIGIKVWDNLERCIFTSEKKINELTESIGETTALVTIPEMLLTPGDYKVSFALHVPNVQVIEVITDTIYFEVVETGSDFYEFNGVDVGCVFVNCQWKLIN
jgi:lipopolysaccharide transport system ATP-binding protein